MVVLAWRTLARAWMTFRGDTVTPVRLASHLALLAMALLVLVLSRVDLPSWEIVRLARAQPAVVTPPAEPVFEPLAIGGSPLQESGVLVRAPVPFTEIPDRPREGVITYTVQLDDTVLGIAEQFKLNPNTILWANLEDLTKPFVMEVGQILLIPPIDGVLHTVKEGDTVAKIAKLYKVEAEAIVGHAPNQLASVDDSLTTGAVLVVPDGDRTPPEQIAVAPSTPRGGGSSAPWRASGFVWPTYGLLTQRFWLPAHPAIDIGASTGTPVAAARRGHGDHRGLEFGGLWQHDRDPPFRRLRDPVRPPEQYQRELWRLRGRAASASARWAPPAAPPAPICTSKSPPAAAPTTR
jgi:LysM repeat protein